MTWFMIDDRFHSHPKARRCSLKALGLWIIGASWSSDFDEDGRVPKWLPDSLRHMPSPESAFVEAMREAGEISEAAAVKITAFIEDSSRLSAELVSNGLWETHDGEWVMHDWEQWNLTKTQRAAKREAKRKRMDEYRARKQKQQAEERRRQKEVTKPRPPSK